MNDEPSINVVKIPIGAEYVCEDGVKNWLTSIADEIDAVREIAENENHSKVSKQITTGTPWLFLF